MEEADSQVSPILIGNPISTTCRTCLLFRWTEEKLTFFFFRLSTVSHPDEVDSETCRALLWSRLKGTARFHGDAKFQYLVNRNQAI
jgi:hypothetical protein